jgi:hypothetical protein
VYPLKYCRLVEEEHGIDILKDLINHHSPNDRIKELANMVITKCADAANAEIEMSLCG